MLFHSMFCFFEVGGKVSNGNLHFTLKTRGQYNHELFSMREFSARHARQYIYTNRGNTIDSVELSRERHRSDKLKRNGDERINIIRFCPK